MLPRLVARDVDGWTLVVGVVEVDGRRDDDRRGSRGWWRSPRARRPRRAGGRSSTWWRSPRAARRARRDRSRLGDVADRRRGGVRVDVHDVAGVEPGRVRRRACAARARPQPVGSGGDDVVAVGGDAGTGRAGVRGARRGPRPTSARSSTSDAGALAEHEAVACLVERPGRPLGLVVARATSPASRRSRRSAAGGCTPRCRRRRRRRPGRAGSGPGPSAIASAPEAQALTGACTPPWAPISRPT